MRTIQLLRVAGTAAALTVNDAAPNGQKPMGEVDAAFQARDPFTDDFQAFAEDIMEQWRVLGMSIAVVDGDQVFAKGFGLATLPDTPATPETLYYVGSTSKAHTAATLAHLIDSKAYPELSRGWATPISSIIRDDFVLQDEWATGHITLDDAVSHRTGMPRHDNSWHQERDGNETSIKDIVRNLRNLPPAVEPRVEWHYCNLMYVTLSHVVETLTGRWLGDVLRDTIWKPLAMHSTYLSLQEARRGPAHLASAYIWRDEKEKYEKLQYVSARFLGGAGGIISNVLDYTKWIKCLIDESEPFSKAVHKDIRAPRMISNPEPSLTSDVQLYGLAWTRTTVHGEVAYWHDGSTLTFGAEVYWFPNLKYGIVAFANGALGSNPAEQVLVHRLIEDKLNVPASRRADLNKSLKEKSAKAQHDLENMEQILFPNRPEQRLPPTLPSTQLVGSYYNEGYGTVHFFTEPHPDKQGETMLVANRTEILWAQQWRMQHATGDYWAVQNKLLFCGMNIPLEFFAGEFKLGVDGKVAAFVADFESRSGQVSEGRVLFKKLES
ncbi:penicillin-binding protein [Purpureocillium lilacinum]|uniref:Beta-lactamase/transpeptidase-like protein n=1 Tax=Purpureocillium lilacinum TaxID=33203 RepID=A0A179HHH6_PURLI|nr:penicillin-binding protein [Purpureocillium lilacinum]OAQ88919.1 penicillin-binding protein [Purpureocillium lilacinum]PWI73478.1 Beta-lactamase/transpeptidase-like protein [Purpureocillium lilacinum]